MSADKGTAPSVLFHVHVADVLAYAVRLLRKAHTSDTPVHVLMGDHSAEQLSAMLWALPDAEFVPHAMYSAQRFAAEQGRTRIWLDASGSQESVCAVALNLAQSPVVVQPHLIKLIEVVGTHEAEVLAARARWRRYVAHGWAPEKFVARI